MPENLELPQSEVAQKKAELWATIKGPDSALSDGLYAETLRLIRSPVAQIANEVLDGSRRLRRRLRLLIMLTRALVLSGLCMIAAAIIWSYWFLLAAVGLGIVWYFLVDRQQTAANVELGATLEVFSEMMATDSEFRERAADAIRRRQRSEAGDAVELVFGDAPGSE